MKEKHQCGIEKVTECSNAIAEAVKLCKPEVVAMYPITPQTHIIEQVAELANDKKMDCELIPAESEHSAISAVLGAQATGARTFTATSSQGLALMHEILYIVSALRMPCVMAVVNRALSGPINIWCDHSDAMGERDTGWIQLYCESTQEAMETTIQAYKIAEHPDVMLPVMVCVDGFSLSHVSEVVRIPYQQEVDKFLPKYKAVHKLDPSNPVTIGPIAYPDSYMEFKKQQQNAMKKTLKVIKDSHTEYCSCMVTKQNGNGLIETYKTNDASTIVVGMGSMMGTMRQAVDNLRKKGLKVGMLKIKSYRPFPEDDIIKICNKAKSVIIFDRAVSLGSYGPLYTEIKALLSSRKIVKNFIIGLGGRDVRVHDIEDAVKLKTKDNILWVDTNA